MANTKLNRTAGSTGNRRTWTWSGWVKRSAVHGTADAKGGLFAETALVMVMEGETEPTTEEDTSNRLVEYGLFQSWGESEIADSHGIEVASDVTATV